MFQANEKKRKGKFRKRKHKEDRVKSSKDLSNKSRRKVMKRKRDKDKVVSEDEKGYNVLTKMFTTEVNEGVYEGHRIVIVGPARSGKTYLLCHLLTYLKSVRPNVEVIVLSPVIEMDPTWQAGIKEFAKMTKGKKLVDAYRTELTDKVLIHLLNKINQPNKKNPITIVVDDFANNTKINRSQLLNPFKELGVRAAQSGCDLIMVYQAMDHVLPILRDNVECVISLKLRRKKQIKLLYEDYMNDLEEKEAASIQSEAWAGTTFDNRHVLVIDFTVPAKTLYSRDFVIPIQTKNQDALYYHFYGGK